MRRIALKIRSWLDLPVICKRSVTVWLAAMVVMAASAFAAGAAQVNIVVLGSSTTAGRGVGESAAYPAQLEALLRAKGFDVSIANAGISGDTSAGMLNRLDSAVPAGTQIVLLQLSRGVGGRGSNDARRGISLAQHQANLGAILAWLHARGIKVIEVHKGGAPLQADGIHPTAEGQALIAQRLLPQVAAAIRGSSRRR
jgi:acyl-CoA thioesterase-1